MGLIKAVVFVGVVAFVLATTFVKAEPANLLNGVLAGVNGLLGGQASVKSGCNEQCDGACKNKKNQVWSGCCVDLGAVPDVLQFFGATAILDYQCICCPNKCYSDVTKFCKMCKQGCSSLQDNEHGFEQLCFAC